jgi:hypothetical protein
VAASFYAWAMANHCGGSIYTVFDLSDSAEFADSGVHGMDLGVIMKALRILAAEQKVLIIPGDSLALTGVKFHAKK